MASGAIFHDRLWGAKTRNAWSTFWSKFFRYHLYVMLQMKMEPDRSRIDVGAGQSSAFART